MDLASTISFIVKLIVLTRLWWDYKIPQSKNRHSSYLWQRSSVVEQGTHKPLVISSNLIAATFVMLQYAIITSSLIEKEVLSNDKQICSK